MSRTTTIERVARTLVRRWRSRRAAAAPQQSPIRLPAGVIDEVRLHSDRTLSVSGWGPDLGRFRDALAMQIGNASVAPAHAFRVPRPDVAEAPTDGSAFAGIVVEWLLPSEATKVALTADGRVVYASRVPEGGAPGYDVLRTSPQIYHREHIYASGPPVHVVHGDVVALAATLPPPVLDFGCGGGALVRALRERGIEAFGLELNRPAIRERLLPEVAEYVTLYDAGRAPFPDASFASVTCSEVLEHIEEPGSAVGELARLARTHLFVTVPDMSAIPRGFQHHVVPWHLLESTHVNFFTQHSLEAILRPYAARIEMSRIGAVQCGQLQFYSSLAAVVQLRAAR